MRVIRLFGVLASTVTLVACGQEPIRTVTVTTTATAETEPTHFTVNASIGARADTRDEALAETQAIVERLLERLPNLEGLTAIDIITDAVNIAPVCANDVPRYGDRHQAECEVIAYTASHPLQIHGAPAGEAGNMVSLATELGARRASISNFWIEDRSALSTEATQQAIAKALAEAQVMAAALNTNLGEVVAINPSDPAYRSISEFRAPAMLLSAPSYPASDAPAIEIGVRPEPVRRSATITMVIELADRDPASPG